MVKIFYMTGTGNSLKIARDIGAILGRHELISMTCLRKNSREIIIEGEIIGFIFPIYFGRPPVFIQEFINNARFGNTSYIFALANGGGLFGRSLNIFKRLLKKKNKYLNAGFIIRMPGTHPFISQLHGKSRSEFIRKEAGRVESIAEIVKDRTDYLQTSLFGFLGSLYSFFAFDTPRDLSKKHRMDEHFWMNDGCRNCGLCIEICPVDNLVQSKWKPAWQHNCINCLACYHVCPWKGISLLCDWRMTDLVPYELLNFRYRHPDVTLDDLKRAAKGCV